MTLHQGNSAGFTPLTRENNNLHQPAPNLHQCRSQPALTPAPPVRGAGGKGQVILSKHFTASTCRKCGAITLTGTTYGIRIDLEPTTLDDHTEYAALVNQVPTYDLWPDRSARQRHLEEIKWPDRVPRHAQHTCGTTYGTHPRPTPPATNHGDPNGPPPF